mmetsp:Transcript_2663/g.5939  ORF Transcript_2663/g.5939 Transcript_2663/m.5939 type:complete len:202 (+) Transcript_2663:154-759(+)
MRSASSPGFASTSPSSSATTARSSWIWSAWRRAATSSPSMSRGRPWASCSGPRARRCASLRPSSGPLCFSTTTAFATTRSVSTSSGPPRPGPRPSRSARTPWSTNSQATAPSPPGATRRGATVEGTAATAPATTQTTAVPAPAPGIGVTADVAAGTTGDTTAGPPPATTATGTIVAPAAPGGTATTTVTGATRRTAPVCRR